jgi:hypothetical protein
MLNFMFAGFILLHGLVHLLYAGQSLRQFELRPGMVWPDGSWALSRLLGDNLTRWLAAFTSLVAAIGFMAGGLGLILGQAWWLLLVVIAAVISSVMYVLLWDGKRQNLSDQGGVGLVINLAIIFVLLVLEPSSLG